MYTAVCVCRGGGGGGGGGVGCCQLAVVNSSSVDGLGRERREGAICTDLWQQLEHVVCVPMCVGGWLIYLLVGWIEA